MALYDIQLSPVLVTSGCGFIGYHIARSLLDKEPKYQIHVLDIDTSRNRLPNITYHACDISSARPIRTP